MPTPNLVIDEICRRSGRCRRTVRAALGEVPHTTGKSTPKTKAVVRAALREIVTENQRRVSPHASR